MKQKSKGANRRVTKNKTPNTMGLVKPPSFQSTFSVNKRLRFQAASANSSVISAQNLIQLLCCATTTILGKSILGGIKIKRIQMWGSMASSLTPVTVSCDFASASTNTTGPNRVYTDTSMGTTGAYISVVPPKGSMASFWIPGAGSTLTTLILTYPAGAIVDISFQMVLADGQTADTGSITLIGATAGDVFVNNLDGTGAVLVPVSYASK